MQKKVKLPSDIYQKIITDLKDKGSTTISNFGEIYITEYFKKHHLSMVKQANGVITNKIIKKKCSKLLFRPYGTLKKRLN